jgi:anti-sigma factor RsiW
MTELSDELLVAYVDGQLARKQTQAIDKVLEQDDVIAKRVTALRHAHGRLEAAFDALLAGEEADPILKPTHPPGVFIAWATLGKVSLATAGLVASVFMMLAGFGWPLSAPRFVHQTPVAADPEPEYVGSIPRDWREDAARAQSLLGRASLEVGLESQANPDLVAFQLAQAFGSGLEVPDLGDHGFRFARGQMLNADGEPLAQLLYLGAAGAPLALYVKKGDDPAVPSFKRYGSQATVAWSRSGLAYLLAGEGDETSLTRLANAIRIEKPAAAKAPAYSPVPPMPKPNPRR